MKSPFHIAMLACVFLLSGCALSQTVKEVFAYPTTAPVPTSTPTQGRDGSLYTTVSGFGTTSNNGSVLKTLIGLKGSRVIHAFSTSDGTNPEAGLTLAIDGDFYGVTTFGGSSEAGVLFKITAGGTYTILHEFSGQSDGGYPVPSPVQASDGNLYGATGIGSLDGGTIYRFNPLTSTFTTIFSFSPNGSQGKQISAPLMQGSDGNLYGVTVAGGTNSCGTVFVISTSGSLLQTYSFPCGAGGSSPVSPLVQAPDGNFYGTTLLGGNISSQGECKPGCGTIFRMTNGVVSTLYSFSGFPNDGDLQYGLTLGSDGNLYGVSGAGGLQDLGTLYEISTNGQYKLLYSFVKEIGSNPSAPMLQDTTGKFYGTAGRGGRNGQGSLYSLDMGLGPFIALVRYTGRIGQSMQILGQGMTGLTAVTINGVAATTFKVVSDTYMTAIIPTGATTGPVVVNTPKGTLTSNHSLRIVQ